jgi:hypothetical protein
MRHPSSDIYHRGRINFYKLQTAIFDPNGRIEKVVGTVARPDHMSEGTVHRVWMIDGRGVRQKEVGL